MRTYFVKNTKTGETRNVNGVIVGNGLVRWRGSDVEWDIEDCEFPWLKMARQGGEDA